MDPNLRALAEVSSLISVLRLGGSYELVYQLWARFTLSAVRVNVDVTRSRDEVLNSIATFFRNVYVSCVHLFCCVFSPSFSMGCTLAFCLVASVGQKYTGAAALSLRNRAKRCESFFALGIKTSFGVFAWKL